jgi:geranylgeranyl diphosphate synthase, type II
MVYLYVTYFLPSLIGNTLIIPNTGLRCRAVAVLSYNQRKMSTQASPMKTDYTMELNHVLESFFARNIDAAAMVSPYYEALWIETRRLIQSGGKRLRPKMTLLAYEALGGTDYESILPIAAAQELLHMSMLIHDDIIDRDYIRYGVDNIAGAYNKIYDQHVSDKTDRLHYAHSAALLAGDLLISGAYELITESSVTLPKIIETQRLFAQSLFEVAGGELLDTEASIRELGAIKAEVVARYKTASYTFVGPIVIGATLASASMKNIASLRVFAENIGIAFQLRDDIIGVFGDEAKTGKSTTGDIREGKQTYMIEQFLALATEDQRLTFDHYFGDNSISSDEVDTIKQLLIASGAKQKTEDAIDLYEKRARQALQKVTILDDFHEQLEGIIVIATRREK